MNTAEAVKLLKAEESIIPNQFELLKVAAQEITTDPESHISKEIVLRLLERQKEFTETKSILFTLVRETGLIPYLDLDTLSLKDIIAVEYHRPENLDDIIFHQEQAPVYHKLLAGKNVVLSAPTSFGKSKIIDAIIATNKFSNIVIVVPTLALIDETRRRIQTQFSFKYNVVGHPSQKASEGNNIFIYTPERVVSYQESFPKIDFFVIDEFYKIGGQSEEDRRMIALNEAFYILFKKHKAQFYMLGPNIQAITEGATKRFNFEFISTDFQTVITEVVPIRAKNDEERLRELVKLCKRLKDPTLIYCKSIPQVNAVAETLLSEGVMGFVEDTSNAVDWLSKQFHPDWVLPRALERGVGIHYGPLPRSIAQAMVRLFNTERIQFLICTSTLIEGVNTKAKNVVIFDNKIAREKLDYFTFNNIKGRSGRMFEHFVGRVYRFHEEPYPLLPFVDFPLHSQGENTPESLLIQMDYEDLDKRSRERLEGTIKSSPLPISVLRENHSIEPTSQIELASELISDLRKYHRLLSWSNIPKYKELEETCRLIWEFWIIRARNGVFSSRQLTMKIWNLRNNFSLRERIEQEFEGDSRYVAKNANEAVERILRFDRNWANFDFPQYLMALHRIQNFIFTNNNLPAGDYSFYAKQVESCFLPELCGALDEYGIPTILTEKIDSLRDADNIDSALEILSRNDFSKLNLHPYELELLNSARP